MYYQQGVLLLRAFGRKKAAIAALRRALALNPLDEASRFELELAPGRRTRVANGRPLAPARVAPGCGRPLW